MAHSLPGSKFCFVSISFLLHHQLSAIFTFCFQFLNLLKCQYKPSRFLGKLFFWFLFQTSIIDLWPYFSQPSLLGVIVLFPAFAPHFAMKSVHDYKVKYMYFWIIYMIHLFVMAVIMILIEKGLSKSCENFQKFSKPVFKVVVLASAAVMLKVCRKNTGSLYVLLLCRFLNYILNPLSRTKYTSGEGTWERI